MIGEEDYKDANTSQDFQFINTNQQDHGSGSDSSVLEKLGEDEDLMGNLGSVKVEDASDLNYLKQQTSIMDSTTMMYSGG